MSLGITALWRAQPQRWHGLLIPRKSFSVLRAPYFRPAATSSLFWTRAQHSSAGNPKSQDTYQSVPGEHDATGQQDDARVPRSSEPTRVRHVEVVGQGEEAKELRDWLAEEPRRERRNTEKPKTDVDELEQSLERSKLAKSVFVKPARTYPNRRESRESWREHHHSLSAQVYFDRNVQNLQRQDIYVKPESTDWRHVLSLLSSLTPEESVEWIEDGMKIELSEPMLAAIMQDGGDEKIGAIRRRSGASIKVLRAESPSNSSALLVSGTRAAFKSTIAEFRRIVGRIKITRLWAPLAPDEAMTESFSGDDFYVPPLTREEGGLWRRFKTDYNAYLTPWPTHMSSSSFSQYVASLTDSVVYPHLHSPLYNPTKHRILLDHERAVVRRLNRAFLNDEARPWISCSALKLALSFLCRRGDKYLPEVRSIFVAMDQLGLRMDADVFNMMLRAPTTTRNLRKFRRTVILMTKKGFAPNLDTWILFLRMFESIKIKSHILHAMNSKNLLGTPKAIQRVAEEMAPFDAEHAMSEAKDLSTFVQEQSDRYGPDWLTRDAANQVMDVLCRHGRFQDAFRLLDCMHAHVESIPLEFSADRIAAEPDAVTFNTIISHAKTQGKMPVAVNAIRKMHTTAFHTSPDRITFDLVFEMAWKARLRYTISVIWKYASLARLTTFRMREHVASLLSGAVLHHRTKRAPFDGLSASTYAELGGERLARDLTGGERALAKVRALAEGRHRAELSILASQCWPEAFREYGPRIPFAHLLTQAVLRDLSCLAAARNKAEEGDGAPGRELRFRLKAMPLCKRARKKEYWIPDLAPLEAEGPEPIGAGDRWVLDEMLGHDVEEELKTLYPPSDAGEDSGQAPAGHDGDSSAGDDAGDKKKTSAADAPPAGGAPDDPRPRKMMAILDPDVWDEAEAKAPRRRHKLQLRNERAILTALARLEVNYLGFRKVVYVPDGEASDWGPAAAAGRPTRTPWHKDRTERLEEIEGSGVYGGDGIDGERSGEVGYEGIDEDDEDDEDDEGDEDDSHGY